MLRCKRREQIHYISSLIEEHRDILLAESVRDVYVEEGRTLLRTGEDLRHSLFVLTKRYVEQALEYLVGVHSTTVGQVTYLAPTEPQP